MLYVKSIFFFIAHGVQLDNRVNPWGKDGVGPSSLHITLEGPTEYVNARCM